MTFKRVMTYSDRERMVRLFRLIWERGEVGHGGYSAKFTVGLAPKLLIWRREWDGWLLYLLGVRLHFKRSWGGRFV
jgi:hypothetical protein